MSGYTASRRRSSAREVLSIERLVGGSDAEHQLQPGDLLLAIDGKPITQYREVERAVANQEQVAVTVWRANGEKTLQVHTRPLYGHELDRVVEWAGATLKPRIAI